MKTPIVSERGWAGHFIGARRCKYRRNTLIEVGDKRVVVSTVGNYDPPSFTLPISPDLPKDFHRQIGAGRYYETMAFEAKFEDPYWEADVTKEFPFESNWALDELEQETDLKADAMHNAVVREIALKLCQ